MQRFKVSHLLLLILPTVKNSEICLEEVQVVDNETIIWPSTTLRTLSEPICVSANREPLRRSCTKGNWENQPKCIFVQQNLHLCPDHFLYLKDYFICYKLLPSGPFDMECPYPTTFPIEIFEDLHHITDNFIWYPAIRYDKFGIGEYYYTGSSEYYGLPHIVKENFEKPSKNKQCLVYNFEGRYKAVNCNNNYPKLCAYDYRVLNDICHERFSESCKQFSLDRNSNCICVETSDKNTPRNDFCQENLAEFHESYLNSIYINTISTGLKCWIGLEKFNTIYAWSSSKTQLSYTFWSRNSGEYGDFVAINEDGWYTEFDMSLNCALCEKKLFFSIPTLYLRYETSERKFMLEITALDSLLTVNKYEDEKIKIFCFVNSGKHIKQRMDPVYEVILKNEVYYFKFPPENTGPGYYWCEGFSYFDLKLVSSNEVLLHDKSTYGNEYITKISIDYSWLDEEEKYKNFENDMLLYLQSISFVKNFRRFAILNVDGEFEILTHITTTIKYVNDINTEYKILLDHLKNIEDRMNITINELLSANFCYRSIIREDNVTLTWPTTLSGNIAYSEELCLQANGSFVWRYCNENFINGSQWSKIYGKCILNPSKSNITDQLHELLKNNESISSIVENLIVLTEKHDEFVAIDVHLTGLLLQRISSGGSDDVENVTKIITNIMQTKREILVESQITLESTDHILQNFDKILLNYHVITKDPHVLFRSDDIATLFINLKQGNTSGIALYQYEKNAVIEVLDLTSMLDEEYLEAAILLDKKLIAQIREEVKINNNYNRSIILTLFMKDSLFNEETETKSNVDKVFDVLIPDFHKNFSGPIVTYFKRNIPYDFDDKTCAHWQFLLNKRCDKSYWMKNSGYLHYNKTSNIYNCAYWHVTHFGLLVRNENVFDKTFDTVGTINSILSLCGLCVIFLTSILFKRWRCETGNQLLLHFISVMSLKIILLFISYSTHHKNNEIGCTLVGALLHYSVIAEFCWMFVISILQYRRLVIVFATEPKNIKLKACLIGWFVPSIPIFILLTVSPKNYTQNDVGICYPSKLGFSVTLLLPVGLILFGNVYIFVRIIYDVCIKNVASSKKNKFDYIYECRTIVLLFFMLGVSWIFAFLSYLDEEIIFLHIFNFLTTLQGFMLFLFLVVFNESTRMLYVNLLKRKFRTA